jgi:hypothetical protein
MNARCRQCGKDTARTAMNCRMTRMNCIFFIFIGAIPRPEEHSALSRTGALRSGARYSLGPSHASRRTRSSSLRSSPLHITIAAPRTIRINLEAQIQERNRKSEEKRNKIRRSNPSPVICGVTLWRAHHNRVRLHCNNARNAKIIMPPILGSDSFLLFRFL